uniref:Eukaryotic translation initiation factor 2D n=1 Tax=Esox lucius TaxID=8010 RepID=A0A6Q2YMA2_ESOLU
MFEKAFRVKSNTVIKGSDRRKLKVDISTSFPSLSAEELSDLVPNKEELNVVKIYAHKGDAVTLYVLHKNPVFFELEKRIYPTVYTLWRYPHVLPAFTTWPPVIQKLAGGADLMLPGVVVPSGGLPEVKKGDCCAVKVVGNKAPVAVGTATMTTAEMRSLAMKGRGVSILHSYLDSLWAFGDKSGPPCIPDATEADAEEPYSKQMDALLLQCFLHALKSKVKKSELPLLTSTFLRIHMFSCCPNGKQLDIKKSSYKKLSKFLQSMQQEHRLVKVKELSKGVESIVEVDWKNREWVKTSSSSSIYLGSLCTCVSFCVVVLMKGTVLQPAEVRTIITDYVKRNELVDDTNKNYVIINPILCDCLLEKSEYQDVEALKWDDLFSRTLDKMQHCHQLVFPGLPPVVRKGPLEPIDITVASRGSNKKVTIIKNLEVYGLDPVAVSVALQHRVQASSALNPVPGSKDRVSVQIQGNQVQQVGKLLLDMYQIPRKYIQGLDNKVQKPGKKK